MGESGKQAGLGEGQGDGEADRVEGKLNRIQPHKVGDRIIISMDFSLTVQGLIGLSILFKSLV